MACVAITEARAVALDAAKESRACPVWRHGDLACGNGNGNGAGDGAVNVNVNVNGDGTPCPWVIRTGRKDGT